MQLPAEVRAVRKKHQLKRVEMKKKVAAGDMAADQYSAFYAGQPIQKVKAAENKAIAEQRAKVASLETGFLVARETGKAYDQALADLEAAKARLAELEKQKRASSPGASLGAA